MHKINLRKFKDVSSLNTAVAALLKHHFEREYHGSHAVMLSGGNTPLDAYRLVAGQTCVVSSKLRLFLSDERLVPVTSSESNYGNMRFMFEALRLDDGQVLRANGELDPQSSALKYNADMQNLINNGGNISLGLLGLGADGHTASLFCRDDLDRGRGRYAVSVVAPDGLNRVSVTPSLISKIQQVVFVVSGEDKKPIVEKLTADPSSVIAGLAVAEVRMKELWFAV